MRQFTAYLVGSCLAMKIVLAQSTTSSSSSSSSSSGSSRETTYELPSFTPVGSTASDPSVEVPTGSYASYTGQDIAITTLNTGPSSTGTPSVTLPQNGSVTSTSTTNSLLIVGGTETMTMTNGTMSTATTSSATPTNTQPCNNYPEFCTRRYSNITEVAAHNSAFVRKNNVFSNQIVPVIGQLNDGIRMIQGEVHYVNGTLYNCHSDCNFLNTGTYQSLLEEVVAWLDANPYEVVTLLIVNSDYADVTVYEQPFQDSGILNYIYLPPRRPMRLDDWPTLEEMILTNKRVVAFMDYEANQDTVPYIIDQFTNMWETPFSPVDIQFPCSQQRPPGLSETAARDDYLYMANHNLNVQITLGSASILIPDFSSLALVNSANNSTGSLQTMSETCTSDWGRPPNFLLVDFYNVGGGSVFEVAANMNNVTYNRDCCGQSVVTDDAIRFGAGISRWALLAALLVASTSFL